jgi:guanyl-specific ribonuclease Sa
MHDVTQEHHRGARRWVCSCGWATDWTYYTDPHAAAAAVRHTITGGPMQLAG